MQTVSRRGLFVLGGTGAAGAVLGACGGETSERDEADDAALLSAALAAETALGAAYASRDAALDRAFAATSGRRAAELTRLLEQAGGQPSDPQGSSSGDPRTDANATIAAYRAAAGPLSTVELRRKMIEFLAAVAAEQAAVAELDGADPAPRAFVTGGDAEPNVAVEAGDGGETTTPKADG
jgi:hypothetical protein